MLHDPLACPSGSRKGSFLPPAYPLKYQEPTDHSFIQYTFLEYIYLFIFFLSRAAPVAYGNSQARGQIGAVAASLHHSYSIGRSLTHSVKPGTRPTSSWAWLVLHSLSYNGNSFLECFECARPCVRQILEASERERQFALCSLEAVACLSHIACASCRWLAQVATGTPLPTSTPFAKGL